MRRAVYGFAVWLAAAGLAPGSRAEEGDALAQLEERSREVFAKADAWVVGIRVRVPVPYSAQLGPDGRVIWYSRSGPFHVPDASVAVTLMPGTGPATQRSLLDAASVTVIPGAGGEGAAGSAGAEKLPRRRSWADRYGTGILFGEGGHILTTYQLVKDTTPGSEVAAISPTGREHAARLVAADAYSNIAVLASEGIEGEPAEFAVDDAEGREAPAVGSFAFCVARPYGLPNSAYFGMVSGVGRRVGQFRYERYIQTTIPLPPGSNGAPLLTLDGRVAGMMSCTLKQEGWSEVSFAVPAGMVQRIGKALIERGAVVRGYLGVRVVNREEEAASRGLERGAIVREVLPGAPAMAAGIQAGDLIVQIENYGVEEWEDLVWALDAYQPGETVAVRIVRGDRKLTLPVELGTLAPEIVDLDRRP